MIGKRVSWDSQILNPGEFAKLPDGTWHAATPNGHIANLARHRVTEHEDGMITVAPSILVSRPKGEQLWHGFLERGIWRSV